MDLHTSLHLSIALSPITGTDDTALVGAVIDMQGYESAEFVFLMGVLADAAATAVPLIDESNASNMAGSNAVADGDLLGTEALASFDQADDASVRKIGYVGSKRYIRCTLTPSANAGSFPVSCLCIRHRSRTGTITDGGQAGI